jgi:hypothetical protein
MTVRATVRRPIEENPCDTDHRRPSLSSARPRRSPTLSEGGPVLRIVPWVDPVADPHGLHPRSRYVELYWLGVIGPSTTS